MNIECRNTSSDLKSIHNDKKTILSSKRSVERDILTGSGSRNTEFKDGTNLFANK